MHAQTKQIAIEAALRVAGGTPLSPARLEACKFQVTLSSIIS